MPKQNTETLAQRVKELKEHPLEQHGDETEAGNYFVSNYPPFSYWKPDMVDNIAPILLSDAPVDTNLGLYLHIPFCRKRCHFCYFRVYTDKSSSEINSYLESAIEELKVYSEKPYLQGRKPQFVYFGGGTPSYLSTHQLQDLTDRMKDLFPWDEVEEVAFEGEPGTLNEKKLTAIRDIGVTRLSIGVEAFDDHLLEVNGRAHRSKEAYRAMDFAKSLDFDQVNIDLIAGMMDETEDNWKKCVDIAIEQEPDCVTIYQMEIPYNTTIYKEMQEAGKVTAPVATWSTKRDWVDWAFDRFEAAGYSVTSAYTVVKNPETTKFVYRDSLWAGADLLSVGVASFGHFGGVHYQNQADVGPYMQAMEANELPIFRAYPTSHDERLLREFILQLKLGHTNISYFQDKYGADVTQVFSEPMELLRSRGYLSVDGDQVLINREGLLQIDKQLHEFFLPEHSDWKRYT